jgi:isopentenyl-diphosphate delta-isomerase
MSESRKKDHIALSFTSVPDHQIGMGGFTYEPLLSAHPLDHRDIHQTFLGYSFDMPLWISSMTGGTEKAHQINHNLARACGEFKLGMGLGSCRPLLESNDRFDDFNVKHLMGDAPLFTNFGIAQLEELIDAGRLNKITEVTKNLDADGLIIHVNPLQEWAQVEGDRYKRPAIETIRTICDQIKCPIIIKEVGQGMGPQSLSALLELPIVAIELAGYGGTNFSILEQRRKLGDEIENKTPAAAFGYIGHTAEQMIEYLNALQQVQKSDVEVIVSGGIKDPVTGYILKEKLEMNAVIGMAGTVLKYAMGDYEELQSYLHETKECFSMAKAFIKRDL